MYVRKSDWKNVTSYAYTDDFLLVFRAGWCIKRHTLDVVEMAFLNPDQQAQQTYEFHSKLLHAIKQYQ